MRLIDEDELIKGRVENDPVVIAAKCTPTAYDLDWVVEQIEKLKKAEQDRPDACDKNGYGDGEQIFNDWRSQGRFEAFGEAIKIVKGGGVDG
jgi:hypothetical protein